MTRLETLKMSYNLLKAKVTELAAISRIIGDLATIEPLKILQFNNFEIGAHNLDESTNRIIINCLINDLKRKRDKVADEIFKLIDEENND